MATVLERRLHAETGSANDERAQANRAAAASAAEIVAIIRDSADQHVFTAADATAVMAALHAIRWTRSEEHTSELQSLMRTSYAVFCLKKKKSKTPDTTKQAR